MTLIKRNSFSQVTTMSSCRLQHYLVQAAEPLTVTLMHLTVVRYHRKGKFNEASAGSMIGP